MENIEYLIIGGGYAGDTAAATLRKAAAKGRVVMITAEREYPYLRYTLSKAFMQGQRQKESVYLHPVEFYEKQNIEIRLGTKAVSLDTRRRTVTLETGEELAFQRLLLATGASPRKLAVPGSELPGVYYLRTLADAEALRDEIVPDRQAVIIGGGFIGAEMAASLTQKGVKVTIVDAAQTIWAHLFGETMGRFFHEGLLKRGVSILTQAHVQHIDGEGRAQRVITQEGHTLSCDFVVIGVGVRPETTLAETAGLKVDNGIVVNEHLETSEEGVFAAGDNARFYSSLFESQMRIEHWEVAKHLGATAALNMLGQREPIDEVPYFFSGLFDIWLEYLGHAPNWDKLTVREYGQEKFTALYTQGDQVRGALLVNNSRELDVCRQLIKNQTRVKDFAIMGDPEVELNQHIAVNRQR